MSSLKSLLLMAIAGSTLFGCTPSAPKSDRDQQSYSVGYRLGQQLAPVRNDIDPDVVARGLKDGIKGESKLEEATLQSRLGELQTKQAEGETKASAARLKQAQDFMTSIAAKKGVRVLEPGIVIEETKSEEFASRNLKPEDEIVVRYKAKTSDGKVFDDRSDAGGTRIRYRELSIPGLRKVIAKMPLGASWTVYLAPEQAFGNTARPGLPTQSAVIYELSLVSIAPKK